MLLKRYGTVELIMKMPVKDAMKLIDKAADEENRENAFRMWLTRFPYMRQETYVSFNDFYEQIKKPQIDTRSKDEIMRDILMKGG